MFRGLHVMVLSSDPRATLAFLREVLGIPGFEIGQGYCIFKMAEAQFGCTRPGSEDPADFAALSLLCDDVRVAVKALKARGVEFTQDVENHGYALLTYLRAPGGVKVMLFQPRYRNRGDFGAKASPGKTAAKKKHAAKSGRRTSIRSA